MTKSQRLQAHIRAAVLKDDMRTAIRIYVENRMSRSAFDAAVAAAQRSQRREA